MIYLDDYNNVVNKVDYDYVFCSPPDFEHIGTDPSKPLVYQDYLTQFIKKLQPKKNLITVAYSDRKFAGTIVSKATIVINAMQALGYSIKAHKIWVKTLKLDFFRPTFGNVITFGKGNTKQARPRGVKEFQPDVWVDGRENYNGYTHGMPVNVPKRCILNYTEKGDVVFDPFMGSGTTAIACIETDRQYVGSEISEDCYEMTLKRILETE